MNKTVIFNTDRSICENKKIKQRNEKQGQEIDKDQWNQ